LAISTGANAKVVQKLLGHKTAVLTLDRYGRLYPDDLDAVPGRHLPPLSAADDYG